MKMRNLFEKLKPMLIKLWEWLKGKALIRAAAVIAVLLVAGGVEVIRGGGVYEWLYCNWAYWDLPKNEIRENCKGLLDANVPEDPALWVLGLILIGAGIATLFLALKNWNPPPKKYIKLTLPPAGAKLEDLVALWMPRARANLELEGLDKEEFSKLSMLPNSPLINEKDWDRVLKAAVTRLAPHKFTKLSARHKDDKFIFTAEM